MNLTIADMRTSNKRSSGLELSTSKKEWSCAKVQLVDIWVHKLTNRKLLELKEKVTSEISSTKALKVLKIHQAKRLVSQFNPITDLQKCWRNKKTSTNCTTPT